MATSTISLDSLADRVLATGSTPIDRTPFNIITVVNTDETAKPNTAWVEVGIKSGGLAQANITAVLAKGYVSGLQPLTWIGDITGDANQSVYVNVWANAVDTFRVTVTRKVG